MNFVSSFVQKTIRDQKSYWRWRREVRRERDLQEEGRVSYERIKARGLRIIKISFPNRIGHLCGEMEAFIKETLLDGGDTRKYLLPDLGHTYANRHLLKYFAQYVLVESVPHIENYLRREGPERSAVVETHPYAVAMYETARAFEVLARWGNRPSLFTLDDDDRRTLSDFLQAAGVPNGAWYVCLHAREGGYSPTDEAIHKFRSVDIDSYTQAVESIIDAGGWVVRMGDKTMRPYRPHPRVIDYALSSFKSEQLDVALCGSCRFLLGSQSGVTNIANLFGSPCVMANTSPMAAAYSVGPADIAIPQRLRDREGKILPLTEIMQQDCANFRLNSEFIEHGLQNEPNTPGEIAEAVSEMIGRLDGTVIYTEEETRRQNAFRSLFRQGHYAFKSGSSIGRDFLRRNM